MRMVQGGSASIYTRRGTADYTLLENGRGVRVIGEPSKTREKDTRPEHNTCTLSIEANGETGERKSEKKSKNSGFRPKCLKKPGIVLVRELTNLRKGRKRNEPGVAPCTQPRNQGPKRKRSNQVATGLALERGREMKRKFFRGS